MNTRRKSTLFLVEQLIVIAVFALCAVACISILTSSYFMAGDTKDVSNALIAAQNFAENLKASSPGGASPDSPVYFNKNWQIVSEADAAGFVLTLSGEKLTFTDGKSLYECIVSVGKASGGNLVSFPVAVRGK